MARLHAFIALLLILLAMRPGTAAGTGPIDDPTLIAAAQKEGSVALYSTFSESDTRVFAQRFQATYGIAVQSLRADAATMAARILTEQRAGRFAADATIEAGFQADQLKRAGALERYPLPECSQMLTGTCDPDGYWADIVLNAEIIGYNVDRIKALGLSPPRSWDDLTGKAWRGNFAMYASSFEWYQALQHFIGKSRADAIARAFAANQPQLLGSHSQLISQLVSGEVAAVAGAYAYDALLQRDRGAPIDFVNPTPTVLELATIQVVKNPPHPNAAHLFARWIESHDTQEWMRQTMHRASPRKDVKNDPRLMDPKIRYVISNPADSVNADAVMREYNEIFGRP